MTEMGKVHKHQKAKIRFNKDHQTTQLKDHYLPLGAKPKKARKAD